MSDIVERLKAHDLNVSPDWKTQQCKDVWMDEADTLMSEAAAEITRLREQFAGYREESTRQAGLDAEVIDALRQELAEAREIAGRNIDGTIESVLAWADNLVEQEKTAKAARAKAIEEAARVGYRECAETRHVKLGDAVAAAIRSLAEKEPT